MVGRRCSLCVFHNIQQEDRWCWYIYLPSVVHVHCQHWRRDWRCVSIHVGRCTGVVPHMDEGGERALWTSWTSHYPWLFSGGGDYCLARQPPILPSSRQTKGMDASQTECLNLAGIKGLNRKLQSSRENFNEPRDSQILEKTTWRGPLKAELWSGLILLFHQRKL